MKKSKKEERIIFLEGKKVILRPLDKEKDLEKCLKWINDPEIRYFLTAFMPTERKKQEEWFDKERKNEVMLAIETGEQEFIGTISLARIDYRNGTAMTGTLIGEKKCRNKGYGTDAKMTLLNYAFNTLNLRKIYSNAHSFNKRSINYSKKCGYKVEAVFKKDRFVNGKYIDTVCLSVFKKDFLPLWEKYQNGSLK